MTMTRAEIKSYVRNKAREFDEQGMKEALLEEDCNQAMWNTQIDLIPYNVKSFNKVYYTNGRYFALPPDCLSSPNAIEDVQAGAGVKSSGASITSGGGTITVQAIEPGTEWNDWELTFNDTGTLGGLIMDFANKTINVNYNGSTTTNSQMINLLNSDMAFKSTFIATTVQPSEAMLDSIVPLEITGGTGVGMRACAEWSVKDRNRLQNDTYGKATVTEPKYLRHGDSTGSQNIEIFPNTMQYAKVFYYYRFAAMTADTDILPIPDEYRELYLLKLLTKVYESLNRLALEQEKKVDFATKKKEYEKNYVDALNNTLIQNKMINANDTEN